MDSKLLKRFRRSSKPPRLKIAVLGLPDSGIEDFRSYVSDVADKPIVPTFGIEDVKYKGRHAFFDLDFLSLYYGGRSAIRPMLKLYVSAKDSKIVDVFIIIVDENKHSEDYMADILKDNVDYALSSEEARDCKAVFLFNHSDETKEEFQSSSTPSQPYLKVIEHISKRHRTTFFTICAKTGEGVDNALDWITDQTEQDRSQEAEPKSVTSKQNGIHWLARVGKKVLSFGLRQDQL